MSFSSPVLIAEHLANAGFSALSVANNHAYDQGQRGLDETLEHLKAAGVEAFGLSDKSGPKATARSSNEMASHSRSLAIRSSPCFSASQRGRKPDQSHNKAEATGAQSAPQSIGYP